MCLLLRSFVRDVIVQLLTGSVDDGIGVTGSVCVRNWVSDESGSKVALEGFSNEESVAVDSLGG